MPPLDAPPSNPKSQPEIRQDWLSPKCKNCGERFPRRRGGNEFCSERCRYQYTNNSRSAARHVRAALGSPTRSEFLRIEDQTLIVPVIEFVDSLPTGITARQELIWRELRQLDQLLFAGSLIDPTKRRHIRARATVIATALRRQRHPGDRALFIHAREILSNVGIEGPVTAHKVNELLGHARAVTRFFLLENRNNLELARALMTWGNIERTLWGESFASPRFTWAFELLNENCYRYAAYDRTVAWYFHRATSWRLRCRGRYMGMGERQSEIDRLLRLATTVKDPMLWVEHYRDAAGYASYLLGNRSTASERLRDLSDARGKLTNSLLHMDPTILRATIEYLFESKNNRDKEEAVELIRGRYLSLYLENRTFYYHRQLIKWSSEYRFRLAVPLPPPEYFNAFFVPRGLEESCSLDRSDSVTRVTSSSSFSGNKG